MNLPEIVFNVGRNDLNLGLIGLSNVSVKPSQVEWDEFEDSIFRKIRDKTSLEDIKDDPIFRSYRDLYWSFGMDPTKLRISSEALLRRIVNGLNLWRISNVVDIVNLASAHHKIPIGLIDASKIEGMLQIRQAMPNEIFTRIGGERKVCRGREIVLSDDTKIVCFGFATHDSNDTKVTDTTETIFVIMYGAPAVSMEYLETSTYDTLVLLRQWMECDPIGIKYFQCST